MTMNSHVARALRRAAVVLGMVLGAEELVVYDWLHADPEVPPPSVDRVQVRVGEGAPYDVTDSATVARITEIVRARARDGIPLDRELCFWGTHGALDFYEGPDVRAGVFWSGRAFYFSARGETVMARLGEAELAELRRLLAPAGP